jgi:hypothetical protein
VAAQARVDGLVDFILHLRTSDVCDKKTSDLAATELLFAVDEEKCKKSEVAISAFMSNEEGRGLVAHPGSKFAMHSRVLEARGTERTRQPLQKNPL